MNFFQRLLGCFLVMSISACGGGGGGKDVNKVGDATVDALGSVSKGLFAKADVTVWAVAQNGRLASEPLATFTSSDNGDFSGDIIASKGDLLYLEASAKADGSSRMYCDMTSCGDATIDALDLNSNGRVDFGEWFAVPQGFELTAYVEYTDALTPLRVNLLTHMVSQALVFPITKNKLDNHYDQLVDTLQLSSSPAETRPFDPSSVSSLSLNDLKDNMLISGLLNASGAFDLNSLVSDAVENYQSTAFFTDDTFSFAEISARAVAVTEMMIENVPDASLSNQVKENISQRMVALNDQVSSDENRLSAAQLPKLPPEL
jgi:hypothetical protein